MSTLILEREPDPIHAAPPAPESGPALVDAAHVNDIPMRIEHMRRPPASIGDVQALVCKHYSVKRVDLLGNDRSKGTAIHARHVAMYLCKQVLRVGFSEIGREFGNRDHTTIMKAVRRIEKEIEKNLATSKEVEALLAEIGAAQTAAAQSPEAFHIAFLEGENRSLLRRLGDAERQRAEAFATIARMDQSLGDAERARTEAVSRATTLEAERARIESEALRAVAAVEARAADLAAALAAARAELEALRAAPVASQHQHQHPPAPRAQRSRGAHAPAPVLQLELPAPVGGGDPATPAPPAPGAGTLPPPPLRPLRAPRRRPRPSRPPAARPQRQAHAAATAPAASPAPRPAARVATSTSPPRPASPNLGAFAPKPLDEVRAPRDYFRCERWQGSLAAEDCAKRHELASAPVGSKPTSATLAVREKRARFERCAWCEVGDAMVKLVQLTRKAKGAADAS